MGQNLASTLLDIDRDHPDKARMSLNACKTVIANNDNYYGSYALAA